MKLFGGNSKFWGDINADFWHVLRAKWGEAQEPFGIDSDQLDDANRRSHDRFESWGTVAFSRCDEAPAEGVHLAVVEDASPSGLYIAIRQPPAIGTLLRLQIYCQAGPHGISVVDASGIVRWCRSEREPKGAGIEILDFADGERGRMAWLELMWRQCPTAAAVAPSAASLQLLPAALLRDAVIIGSGVAKSRAARR